MISITNIINNIIIIIITIIIFTIIAKTRDFYVEMNNTTIKLISNNYMTLKCAWRRQM